MVGNLTKRNQNLYCHYHQEQGYTTEDCRNLWDHLDQLVREGKLKSLLHHSNGQGNQMSSDSRKKTPGKMLLLGLLWERSMSSSPLLKGLDPTPPE